jgi:hypothetical protein
MRILYAMALLAGLVLFCRSTPVMAADNDGTERLERLEHRVNEMAQRQEQFMQRLNAQMEHREQMMPPGNPALRPQDGPVMQQCPAPACPQMKRAHCCLGALVGLCLLGGMVINILIATWIYTDIRKRNEGSGIFVALALLAGIPTAIIYAISRIGDKKP